jgi:hypothetical protein
LPLEPFPGRAECKQKKLWLDVHQVLVGFWGDYLFDQINASQKIHSKINELPDDALFGVLLLFEDEHVMIEELLQLFVSEIDTELLKAIELFIYRERERGRETRLCERKLI